MTYPCPTCHGAHGWWVDGEGRRIDATAHHHPANNPADPAVQAIVAAAFSRFAKERWRECSDCIAGISSCCDGAGSAQPEPPSGGLWRCRNEPLGRPITPAEHDEAVRIVREYEDGEPQPEPEDDHD